MDWFLPRGYCINQNTRIKKLLSEGEKWQIFLTNFDTFVLAVEPELLNIWTSEGTIDGELFKDTTDRKYKTLLSSEGFVISSLAQGPFPHDNLQIKTFSSAFKTILERNPGVDLHDGIFVEEYSLLLPVSFKEAYSDNGIAYGKWLTGGINISISSIDRVSKIMSWLPTDVIIDDASAAGFELKSEQKTSNNSVVSESNIVMINKEKFSLIGRPELESFFVDNIIDIVLNQEKYSRMGISFPGATILYGPPGCGKTYAVDRLTEYLGWQRFDIDSSTIASSYIHDTSKKISEIFHKAIEAAPSILVIDEMEAFLSDRTMSGTSATHHVEEVAEFLRRIPEAITNNVLIFAMTNMIESIDPAILRRGRFDHMIEVKMPSAAEIEALLENSFNKLPVDESVNPKYVAENLDEHPMSDVTFVLREAGRFAVKQDLEYITPECFEKALNLLPKKKEKAKIGF